MAEDNFANGVDDRSRIEALERERDELASEIAERKEQIKKLTLEIEGLRSDGAEMREKVDAMEKEVERSREASKAVEAIAARAAELETEVARLQHDAISEMSAAEEARTEAAELRKLLSEKVSRAESLEREVESLKKVKSESEAKIRDLERKIGVLEKKEVEERSKRIRVDEEMRDKIQEKDKEILGLGQKIKELENFADSKKSELEEWLKEKLSLKEALKGSEERARSLELSVARLREEAGEAENVIRSLNEKFVKSVNGGMNGNGVVGGEGKGLKVQWPVLAAGSTGAIVAVAAVIYVYGKRR